MEIVLVVAAHPDDEVLGCGGTIAKHANNNDKIFIVFMADGVASRIVAHQTCEERNMAAIESCKILGAETPVALGFPDNKMDSIPLLEIVQALEVVIDKIKPTVIYTHHYGDLNIDHVITHRAVMTACRPIPGQTIKSIYGFEVLSSTEWASPEQNRPFVPTHFVSIGDYLERKLSALSCYTEEMKVFPHARSIEATKSLVILRGSQVGLKAAEAFSVLRQIKDS